MSEQDAAGLRALDSAPAGGLPRGGADGIETRRRNRFAVGTLLGALFLLSGPGADVVQYGWVPAGINHSTLANLRRVVTGAMGADSWAPMHAALKAAGAPGKGGIYQQIFFEHQVKFQYPPSSLLPVAALDWIRGPASRERQRDRLLNGVTRIAYFLTVAATVALLDLRLRSEARRSGRALGRGQRSLAAVGAAGMGILFYPLVKGVTLGQIQIWIDLLFVLALLFWLSRREGAAGVALGLTVWLKPQYGLILLWGLLRRRWRFASAFAVTAIVGTVWAILVYGFAEHLDYLKVLSVLARHGESYFPNNSVNGLLHRWAGIGNPEVPNAFTGASFLPPYVPWIYVVTLATSIAILALGLWRARGAGEVASAADLGAMTLAATMASPIAWSHHYGILAPLLALLFASWWGGSRRVPGGWLLVAYLLAANCFAFTLRFADSPWNFLESHLYGGAWIVLVLLMRLRNEGSATAEPTVEPRRAVVAAMPAAGAASRV